MRLLQLSTLWFWDHGFEPMVLGPWFSLFSFMRNMEIHESYMGLSKLIVEMKFAICKFFIEPRGSIYNPIGRDV